MAPEAFVSKWKSATLKERSAAQEHLIDLCRLLEPPTPAEADPTGSWFCFEKSATKAGGGEGWTDYTPDMPEDEILRRLLALNLERTGSQG